MNNQICGVLPEIVSVPSGITQAVYIRSVPYQEAVQLRLVAGGTLFILPASNGQTYVAGQTLVGSTIAGSTMAAIWATFGYQVGASGTESVVEIQGPAAFYLGSNGGTATVHLLRKLTQQG